VQRLRLVADRRKRGGVMIPFAQSLRHPTAFTEATKGWHLLPPYALAHAILQAQSIARVRHLSQKECQPSI
jgi:hypothetical protein